MADAWDQFPDANAPQGAADPFAQFPDHPAANRMGFAPSDLASYSPPVSTASDMLHSFGTGLAKGGIGLSTIAGNLEGLGRAGFNKAFDIGTKLALGQNANVPSPISNQTFFPTAGEVTNKIEHDYGKFYQPQTMPGQYAETAGEFAPGALAGGPETSLLTRALNVAVPAVTSETAGQLTAGTPLEPYARTAGALVSGKLPNAATVPMRIATPLPAEAARLEHVANLERQGITALSAGERTGNTGLRALESEAGNQVLGGASARNLEKLKGEQATRAAWRVGGANAGVDAADISPETIQTVADSWANRFNGLAKMTNFRMDPTLTNKLYNIRTEFLRDLPAESLRSPAINNIVDELTAIPKGTIMSGAQYQNIRSRIGALMGSARANNPYLTRHLGEIQDALDDAMERNSSPQVQAAWKSARSGYRDFLAIQDAAGRAGENTANGILSMPALRNVLAKQEGKNFAKSQRPLVSLARSAEGVMKPIANSGTPTRQLFRDLFSPYGAGVGLGLGTATAGPIGAIIGTLAGAVTPVITRGIGAKAITNRFTQGWLGSQRATAPLAAYQAGQSIPWWYLPQGLSPAAEAEAASEAKKKKGSP